MRAFSLVLGTKKDTHESRQSAHTGDETTTTTAAEEKKQNIKAGEGHQITTALSLLKATIGPSPFFFFSKRSG